MLLPSWNMQNIYILLIEIFISKENLPSELIYGGREHVFLKDRVVHNTSRRQEM